MCLFVDGGFAVTVTVLRSMTDSLHVWNMWLQLKMNKRRRRLLLAHSRSHDDDEATTHVNGDGSCESGASNGVSVSLLGYMKAKKGFCFDLFVILPFSQVTLLINPIQYILIHQTNSVFVFM